VMDKLRELIAKWRDKAVRWSLAGPTVNGQTVDALRYCADELEQALAEPAPAAGFSGGGNMDFAEQLLENVMMEMAHYYSPLDKEAVMKRRLLPLLLAGEMCHDDLVSVLQSEFATKRNPNPELKDAAVTGYRAAKQKAMEP